MDRNDRDAYLDFVRPYYAGKDPAHDFPHIERIFARLTQFSEGVHPAPETYRVYFVAAFHGLAPLLRDDEAFGAKVRHWLQAFALDEDEIQEMFDGLFSHLKNPQRPEEQIVHDANYVEMLGAFGIAKAFTTGGARGQGYKETADIFENRFLDKVEFRTLAGIRLASERKAYTKDFLKQLRSEG